MFKELIKYTVHQEPTLQPFDAIGYEYVMASNGVFLRAENRFVSALVPIVPAKAGTVRGLHPLTTKIKLKVKRLPSELLIPVKDDARNMRRASGPINEALYRFHHDGQTISVNRPSQDTSVTSVRTTGDGGPLVILELHSHGNMNAFWSGTDNRDEQGFRFYGVIGRLDSDTPEMRLRATLRVANALGDTWISLSYNTRFIIYGHESITFRRFGIDMTNNTLIHINFKLYQADEGKMCPNCNSDISRAR